MNIIEASKAMRAGFFIGRPAMGWNTLYATKPGFYICQNYQKGEEEHQFDCDELEALDWCVFGPGEKFPWDKYGRKVVGNQETATVPATQVVRRVLAQEPPP